MLRIEFTEEERQALHYERFHHPHPRVQQRMEALWLKSLNLPHAQIAVAAGIDETTLRSYLRAYQQGGIEMLKALAWHGPESELARHQDLLKDVFLRHPPATAAEAGEKIAELTGIRRKPTQIRQFLKRMGMAPRRVAAIPAKADVEAQRKFHDHVLQPKLQEAQNHQRALFFH